MSGFIRTSSVELIASEEQLERLKKHSQMFHEQGRALMKALLAMRGETFFLRKQDEIKEVTEEQIQEWQLEIMGDCPHPHKVKGLMREIYEGVIGPIEIPEKGKAPKKSIGLQSLFMFSDSKSGTPETATTGRPCAIRKLLKKLDDDKNIKSFEQKVRKTKNNKYVLEPYLKAAELTVEDVLSWGEKIHDGTSSYEKVCCELQDAKLKKDPAMMAAKKLKELGLLPLTLPHDNVDNKMKRAVWHDVIGRLEGWQKSDQTCRKETEELLETCQKLKAKISPEQVAAYVKFYEMCRKEGTGITGRCIIEIEKFLKKGFPKESVKGLGSSNYFIQLSIYQQEEFRILDEVLAMAEEWHYYDDKYLHKQKSACVSMCDMQHSPLRVSFDRSNQSEFFLRSDGERFFVTLELQDGPIDIKCHRSRYFGSPEIEPIKTKQKKVTEFEIKFTRSKGRKSYSGVSKSIGLRVKKDKVFVSVPCNHTEKTTDETKEQRAFFSTVIGNSVKETNERRKSVKTGLRVGSFDLGISPVFSCVVFELASRQSGESFEVVDGLGHANFIDKHEIGNYWSEYFRLKLKLVNSAAAAVSQLVNVTKIIRDNKKYAKAIIQKRIPRLCCDIINFSKECDWLIDMIPGSWIITMQEALVSEEIKENDSQNIRQFVEWVGSRGPNTFDSWKAKDACGKAVQMIKSEIRKLQTELMDRPNCCAESFQMLKLIRQYCRIVKRWERYKREIGEIDVVGGKPHELIKWQKYRGDSKDDFLKKAAYELVEYFRSKGVTIILCEDLDMPTSRKNQKQENDFLSFFSPKAFLNQVEQAAEEHGILVQEIDPNYSSLVYFRDHSLMFRDKRNEIEHKGKGLSYFVHGKNVESGDSDYLAAMNLQQRFWTKQDKPSTLPVKRIKLQNLDCVPKSLSEYDEILLCTVEKPSGTHTRKSSYMKRYFPKQHQAFVSVGSHLDAVSLTPVQFKKLLECPGHTEKIVRQKDSWLSDEQKSAEFDRVKALAKKKFGTK